VRAVEKRIGLKRPVGAAVEDEVHVVRDDGAVLLDARFHVDDRGMPGIAGDKLFVVIHYQLDRPARLLGQ